MRNSSLGQISGMNLEPPMLSKPAQGPSSLALENNGTCFALPKSPPSIQYQEDATLFQQDPMITMPTQLPRPASVVVKEPQATTIPLLAASSLAQPALAPSTPQFQSRVLSFAERPFNLHPPPLTRHNSIKNSPVTKSNQPVSPAVRHINIRPITDELLFALTEPFLNNWCFDEQLPDVDTSHLIFPEFSDSEEAQAPQQPRVRYY
jgi:hypothetical protein